MFFTNKEKPTKRKTRKFSMVLKQMMLIGVVVWVAICIVVLFTIQARSKDYKNLANKETLAVSSLIAHDLDIEKFKEAIAEGEESEAYAEMHQELNSIMNICDMEYIYTLWTDGDTVYYGIDGDSNPAAYGDEFEESYEYLADAFNGEIVSDKEFTDDGDGVYLMSAYVPIVDEDGTVLGVLACDYNATEIRNLIVKAWCYLFVFATAGTALANVSLYWIINGSIKNIIKLNDKIDELVYSNGDLTKEIDVKSGDELENLANSVNSLLKYIREIVINISNGSKQVNEASGFISDSLGEAQVAISDVSAAMEEMSAGMEETSASLMEITTNVNSIYEEIAGISDKSEDSATYCNTVMNKANDIYENSEIIQKEAIDKTNTFAATIEEKIENSKRVAEISELVDAIMQISNQTNLLSLNASIEAAHAGESGRGFAVVAHEIGKLANECKESASRISEVSEYVIEIVNELAQEAENMVEFARNQISDNCEQLKDTSNSYKNDVHEIGVLMQNFTASCEELKNVMDGIKESIGATNIAVEETTRGIANTAEAVVTLSASAEGIMAKASENAETSEKLDQEVNKFTY